MEVTLHGVRGVCVTRHVEWESNRVLEHVPIPRQNMEDEHAIISGHWDKLKKGECATEMLIVQVTK